MAANSQSRGIASVGKRFVNQIWRNSSSSSSGLVSSPARRGVHVSVYDKNIDEQVRPTIVPDDVIKPDSDKYWAPHPQTGVFGPAAELGGIPARDRGRRSSPTNGGDETVLEQQAFFRPLEDIEKPQQP